MASIGSILGRVVSSAILLARVRRRHPGCRVDSVFVSPDASLADSVRIAHDVEIRANVPIGRWAYIEPYMFVNGAEVGAFCAICRNAAIGCFEHPYTYPADSAKFYRVLFGHDDFAPPVRIGSDVWAGEKPVILQKGSAAVESLAPVLYNERCSSACDISTCAGGLGPTRRFFRTGRFCIGSRWAEPEVTNERK